MIRRTIPATRARKKKRAQPEFAEQCAFFDLVRLARKTHPHELGYRLCAAWPNGAYLPRKKDQSGNWYSPEGGRLRAAGLEAGMPDIVVLVPRGGYPYLVIEMKRPGGRLSEAQVEKRAMIQSAGGLFAVCHSAADAWLVLQKYLE